MKKVGISPLIEKYSEVFEKDSSSRVFAPLAEGYRQAGLIDRAMEILKVGIRHNPAYLQGYITLGNCYFDMGEFNLAYTTLRPLISENRDNIRLQKLFASSCVELEHSEEALESYKYLLFLNPRDVEVSNAVSKLEGTETEIENIIAPVSTEKFEINEIQVKPEVVKSNLDEWIKVDLEKSEEEPISEPDVSNWEMEKKEKLVEPIKLVKPISLESEEVEPVREEQVEVKSKSQPVITHSLVDLYIDQGHISKAKELLAKIIELNPQEESSIKKLEEINSLESSMRLEVEGEEEGRQRLMDSLDKKLGHSDSVENSKVVALQTFLDAIQKRSDSRKNSQL